MELVYKIIHYKEKSREDIKIKINENYCEFLYNNHKFQNNSLFNIDNLQYFYEEGLTCILPNIIKDNDKTIEKTMMFINMSDSIENLDASILHEFNHLYELMYNYNGDLLYTMFGWDYSKAIYDSSKEVYVYDESHTNKREYELFNEIINDLISQEIGKKCIQKEIILYRILIQRSLVKLVIKKQLCL